MHDLLKFCSFPFLFPIREPFRCLTENSVSTQLWGTLYTLEYLANVNPVYKFWLPLAFQDPALIHSLIGCADIYISGYKTIRKGGRGLRHLQASIVIVNLRLENMGTPSSNDNGVRGCNDWNESIGDVGGEEWINCGVGKTKKCRLEMMIILVAGIALLEVSHPFHSASTVEFSETSKRITNL